MDLEVILPKVVLPVGGARVGQGAEAYTVLNAGCLALGHDVEQVSPDSELVSCEANTPVIHRENSGVGVALVASGVLVVD